MTDSGDPVPSSGTPASSPAPADAPKSEVPAEANEGHFTGAPVCAGLLAANVGVFAAQVYLSGDYRNVLGMPDAVLRWLGANAALWTIGDNRLETLVTSLFLHQSIIHLVLNMLVLWFMGPLLERAIGSARFFPLYLAAGIVASASSAIWGRYFGLSTVSYGASGALCGLVAAATVVGVRTEGWRGDLTVGMGRWLALFVLIGLLRALFPRASQIDNAAHIGGAVGGAIIATTWQRGFTYARRSQHAIMAVSLGVVLSCGAVVYIRNHTDPFIFMNVEERLDASDAAYRRGDCDKARSAMMRAIQMDPQSRNVRIGAQELARECWDPSTDRPSPRIRP